MYKTSVDSAISKICCNGTLLGKRLIFELLRNQLPDNIHIRRLAAIKRKVSGVIDFMNQLPSCSGLESSGPSQLRASFLTVAHLLLRNVPSALALKFLLTDSFLAVIRFCRGLTHFGSEFREVSLNPEMDFNGPSELRKISKE
ncbi:unnamed protein product [Danaus chrysippus]|uniref:(African queen) hypothetical protein n=1 Tax=Danaus chrysippus TaxID=151541 RepID=A0A8J2MDV4_9NEOP|nr:unnamed protein product [Danaus chrysippus]